MQILDINDIAAELQAADIFIADRFDVAVVGAGHAGIEAAYAACKLSLIHI